MRIGQLSFMQMDAPAVRPYGHPALNSKYQGQSGPGRLRYRENGSAKPEVSGTK